MTGPRYCPTCGAHTPASRVRLVVVVAAYLGLIWGTIYTLFLVWTLPDEASVLGSVPAKLAVSGGVLLTSFLLGNLVEEV